MQDPVTFADTAAKKNKKPALALVADQGFWLWAVYGFGLRVLGFGVLGFGV